MERKRETPAEYFARTKHQERWALEKLGHPVVRDPDAPEPTIVSVQFSPEPGVVERSLRAGARMQAHARFSDDTSATVFSFYSDELAFTEAELRGLTAAEARALRRRRDVDYLQS